MKTNHLQYGTRMHIALLSIESAVRFVDVVIVAVRLVDVERYILYIKYLTSRLCTR